MKGFRFIKAFLCACLLMLGGGASAQSTETIDITTRGYENCETVTSIEGTDVTLTFTKGTYSPMYYTAGTAIRIYKDGGSMTVASERTMTQIDIVFHNKTESNVTPNVAPNDYVRVAENKGKWNGSANSVTFTASAVTRIQKVTVTFAEAADVVAAPTISPATNATFAESQEVAITSAEGTTICYTTDGSEPVVGVVGMQSKDNAVAFSVSKTTIVKAIALKGEESSAVATAEYYKEINGLSALVEQIKASGSENKTYYVNLTGAVVTGVSGSEAYIQEGDAAVYLYAQEHGLQVGQKYAGLAKVVAGMTEGRTQLADFECTMSEEGVELPLAKVTLADLKADISAYLFRRVKLEDAVVIAGGSELSQTDAAIAVTVAEDADVVLNGNDNIDLVAFPFIDSAGERLNILSKDDITLNKTFHFDASSANARMGASFDAPTLINTYAEAATYKSSCATVATVDAATGEVTLVAAGETVITATLPNGKHTSYALSVADALNKQNGCYYRVTSQDQLVQGGRYLIVSYNARNEIKVMSTTQNTNNRAATTATLSADGDYISAIPSNACEFMLVQGYTSGTWALYDASNTGYLYAASETSNHLKTKTRVDAASSANIEFAPDGVATIQFCDKDMVNVLRYNADSNLFSCYSNTDTQSGVYLYKLHTEFTVAQTGYSTYYAVKAFVMPQGVQGGIITEATAGKLSIDYIYQPGDVVPAGTALLLYGIAGESEYSLTNAKAEKLPTGNLLHGADALDSDGMTYVAGVNVKYYILSTNKEGKNLGFYWAVAEGAPVKYQAGKAFLAVDFGTATEARDYSVLKLEDFTTGITILESDTTHHGSPIYTPTGIYVGTDTKALPKGIYIVGGKKTIL